MGLSDGMRSLIGDALTWSGVALAGAGLLIYYDDVKSLSSSYLGLKLPATAAPGETLNLASVTGAASSVVELKAQANGHYFARADINGRNVDVMVDTGATVVALTFEDAERAGVFLKASDFTHSVATANGIARVAPVMLDRVSVGNIVVRDVQAVVSERGRLRVTLLGMSFLNRLQRVDLRSGVLQMRN
jgi:aspartyl protease family protein